MYEKVPESIGRNGKLWKYMESYGKIWKCMKKYGKVWDGMGKYK